MSDDPLAEARDSIEQVKIKAIGYGADPLAVAYEFLIAGARLQNGGRLDKQALMDWVESLPDDWPDALADNMPL